MSYGVTLLEYIPMLKAAGFKPIGFKAINQWGRSAVAITADDVVVVFLSLDGGFKTYRQDGAENGRGCEPWELEALL